jgi:hypothetical protein
MTTLAWAARPLFRFDRRWWTHRTERIAHLGVHEGGPFAMSDDTQANLERLPVVSFFRLAGIVAVPMAFLLTVLFIVINAQADKRAADTIATILRETDSRYVRASLYEVQTLQVVRDLKTESEAARVQRGEFDRRLLQLQLQIETLKAAQESKR